MASSSPNRCARILDGLEPYPCVVAQLRVQQADHQQ
jgi:hypothetical protein